MNYDTWSYRRMIKSQIDEFRRMGVKIEGIGMDTDTDTEYNPF